MSQREREIFPWGDTRRFNSYPAHIKRIFGGRIQKVSIDAGFTCPNRDGSKGTGGCTYCNNDAFNPSYCTPLKSISAQIAEGVEFHRNRYRRAAGYLAYFQAYSNTYETAHKLGEMYREALEVPGIRGIVIGTRPDCIDDAIIELLRGISERYYVIVEFGVESCNDKTLERINRGHTFAEAVDAIQRTAGAGIRTGAHFIFGLPGESREEMLGSARVISALPLTSVKFHQLQIIDGTAMAAEYRQHPERFVMFTFGEYMEFFIDFLERLNPAIIVERFTGEAPPHLVIAPRWGRKRTDEIMNLFEERLVERDTWQGRLIGEAKLPDMGGRQ
ncbi:MAG: TIGR01212 family radical SAM protein [Bacteroidetes bacterium]|nr:TIGR01212 family radical SAM protein [Bacteroidota bacterium]